jgi:hypothetical protein
VSGRAVKLTGVCCLSEQVRGKRCVHVSLVNVTELRRLIEFNRILFDKGNLPMGVTTNKVWCAPPRPGSGFIAQPLLVATKSPYIYEDTGGRHPFIYPSPS